MRRKVRSGVFRGAGGIGDRPREAEIGQLAVCRRGGGVVGNGGAGEGAGGEEAGEEAGGDRRARKKERGGRCGAQNSRLCLNVCRVVLSCLVVLPCFASCYHGAKLYHKTTNMQEIKLIISTYSIRHREC